VEKCGEMWYLGENTGEKKEKGDAVRQNTEAQ
jgi:hypothetical protein